MVPDRLCIYFPLQLGLHDRRVRMRRVLPNCDEAYRSLLLWYLYLLQQPCKLCKEPQGA